MRLRIAVALLALGMAVAHAMSPADELIIFGKTSSASGSNPGCSNQKLDFSVACNSVYVVTGPLR